jgi:hypothetical protein
VWYVTIVHSQPNPGPVDSQYHSVSMIVNVTILTDGGGMLIGHKSADDGITATV